MKIAMYKIHLRIIAHAERLYAYLGMETINLGIKILNIFYMYVYILLHYIIVTLYLILKDIEKDSKNVNN